MPPSGSTAVAEDTTRTACLPHGGDPQPKLCPILTKLKAITSTMLNKNDTTPVACWGERCGMFWACSCRPTR